jgi:hypothetical protein
VVNPGVRGRVTFADRTVPWDGALDRILAANGLAYQWNENVLQIAPPESNCRRHGASRVSASMSNSTAAI